MQVKSNISDVAPGYDRLQGGVVQRPVVIQLSQVVFKSFVHFNPVIWKVVRKVQWEGTGVFIYFKISFVLSKILQSKVC